MIRAPRFRGASCGFVICVALVACTSTPDFRVSDSVSNWPQRWTRLGTLSSWRLIGRFSLSHGDERSTGGFDWRYSPATEFLAIKDPIGRSVLRLTRNLNGASLVLASGEARAAPDITSLLQGSPGQAVPLCSLRDWALGIPARASPHRLELDSRLRAAVIIQSGWKITYRDYKNASGWELPRKFTIENPTTRLRIVVTEWQPGSVDG